MTEAERLVAKSYEQVDKGIYVWAARGQDVSAMSNPYKWILSKEKGVVKEADRAYALYRKRVAEGIKPILAFDCSGFQWWVQNQCGLGYVRRSAQGIYDHQCKHITEDELTAGDLVFHHNGKKIAHVGMYVGDGLVNECQGRDVGVVTTNYNRKGYWNRWGRYKKLPDPEPQPTPDKVVYVKGGSVYVRKGGSKAFKAIGVAHRGDTYPYLGTADTGWYHIDYKGKDGFISNRADLTELR